VNIHEVLDRVKRVARQASAGACASSRVFDPSLPPVWGDRDNLIQAFMNIVRNAADAAPAESGEIVLTTAYRPGVRIAVNGTGP
jgi:two-component system nitrogen regulation sensor histidine kinase GlnL